MNEDAPKLPSEVAVRLVDDEPKKSTPTLLRHLAELLSFGALLAGLVLSLGWSYAHAWFQEWRMPLASLSIGTDQLFEYGRLVVVANLEIIVPVVAVLAGIVWMILTHLPALTKAAPILMVALLVATWLGAHWMGERAALAEFDALSEGNFVLLPLAEITFDGESTIPADFARDTTSDRPCYRVVYVAPDAIWLARTRDNNREPLVAMVPRDQIVLLRLYPSQGNCPAGRS